MLDGRVNALRRQESVDRLELRLGEYTNVLVMDIVWADYEWQRRRSEEFVSREFRTRGLVSVCT